MGHIIEKDIYYHLGQKIDNMTFRAPWNDALYRILKELYDAEEAELIVKMPYFFADIDRIAKITGYNKTYLRKMLDRLASKGLVVDVWVNDRYRYVASPFVIGIFEFTMMRTGDSINSKEMASLFNAYLFDDNAFYAKNFAQGETMTLGRTLPYQEAVDMQNYTEILDYERAEYIVRSASIMALGLCSCRQEKVHIREKRCDTPLDNCSSFGAAADFLIRRNLAREVSQQEMLDNVSRSKELGLVIEADNVQKNVAYLCHCCGCCCNVLLGITRFGYKNAIVSSNFIAELDESICIGCGLCAKACHINAIEMEPQKSLLDEKTNKPRIDQNLCIGCGVCSLKCKTSAVRLKPRKKRIIYPETTFEKFFLQCLEKGALQNFLFDNPNSKSSAIVRGLVGAFLKTSPVKKALMSKQFRSTFFQTLKLGASFVCKTDRISKTWIKKYFNSTSSNISSVGSNTRLA